MPQAAEGELPLKPAAHPKRPDQRGELLPTPENVVTKHASRLVDVLYETNLNPHVCRRMCDLNLSWQPMQKPLHAQLLCLAVKALDPK